MADQDIVSMLGAAAKSGEVVEVVYLGGSQPGTLRQLAPISISDGKMWARCFPQNVVKSLSISKIRLPGTEATAEYDPDFKPSPRYGTLADFFSASQGDLERLGWHVSHEKEADTDNERVGVYVRLKNGNTRKHPVWALAFETHRLDDAGLVERKRKWLVIERNRNSKSFMHLDQAADYFLQQAGTGK